MKRGHMSSGLKGIMGRPPVDEQWRELVGKGLSVLRGSAGSAGVG